MEAAGEQKFCFVLGFFFPSRLHPTAQSPRLSPLHNVQLSRSPSSLGPLPTLHAHPLRNTHWQHSLPGSGVMRCVGGKSLRGWKRPSTLAALQTLSSTNRSERYRRAKRAWDAIERHRKWKNSKQHTHKSPSVSQWWWWFIWPTPPRVHVPTVVALCPGPSPVPPPPLRRVGVPLNHRGDEASVADWKRTEKVALRADHLTGGCLMEGVLTDSSVLVAVLVPVVSLVIQVWHSHWHFCSSAALMGTKKNKKKTAKIRNVEATKVTKTAFHTRTRASCFQSLILHHLF